MNAWFVHYNSYKTDGTLLHAAIILTLTQFRIFPLQSLFNVMISEMAQNHVQCFKHLTVLQCYFFFHFGISKNNPFSVMAYFCSIHVNMQHNHVHMKHSYVNMPDNQVNMRHKSCCMYVAC